jgi:hypothetical protein
MPDDVVRELEVYKMLARLGIELGAGVIPRYGLMSVTVPLTFEEGMTGVAFAFCQRAPERGAARAARKLASIRRSAARWPRFHESIDLKDLKGSVDLKAASNWRRTSRAPRRGRGLSIALTSSTSLAWRSRYALRPCLLKRDGRLTPAKPLDTIPSLSRRSSGRPGKCARPAARVPAPTHHRHRLRGCRSLPRGR